MGSFVFLIFSSLIIGSWAADCTTEGFICRGKCTELVRCASAGNDTFITQVVRRCPGTIAQFCNSTSLNCAGTSCEDSGMEPAVLTCHEDGIYPHPTHCNRFFSCKNHLVTTQHLCPSNTSYNAETRNCSSDLNSRTCVDGPIPTCQSVADIGGYPEDPVIFYLCAYDVNGYLRPHFRRCLDGYVYNPELATCVVYSGSSAVSCSISLVIAVFLLLLNIA